MAARTLLGLVLLVAGVGPVGATVISSTFCSVSGFQATGINGCRVDNDPALGIAEAEIFGAAAGIWNGTVSFGNDVLAGGVSGFANVAASAHLAADYVLATEGPARMGMVEVTLPSPMVLSRGSILGSSTARFGDLQFADTGQGCPNCPTQPALYPFMLGTTFKASFTADIDVFCCSNREGFISGGVLNQFSAAFFEADGRTPVAVRFVVVPEPGTAWWLPAGVIFGCGVRRVRSSRDRR